MPSEKHIHQATAAEAMATVSVNDRRNKQIQDAIDGQNWKQALQLCEKRIKKGEDTIFLKSWKALILCHYPDEVHHKRGVSETLALCNLDPPVADVEVLNLLQTSLDEIKDQKQLSNSLWEKAAKRKPQDENLQRRWYSFATGRNDWKSAQKAAMSLQNNFHKERKYYFWAIFMAYLISQDEQSTEMERKLFGTLSYRMISKAASMVPADPKELLSPPRAIQNAEELYLLLEIYGGHNYVSEALTILDSPSLGPKSRIAQGEGTVLLSKIKFLRKAERWEDALSFCRELLGPPEGVSSINGAGADKSPDRVDEWEVWRLLLTSTEKIATEEARKSTKKFLQAHTNCEKPTRNARLAYLDLVDKEVKTGRESGNAMFKACASFWLDYQHKIYCFYDLRPYIFHLDRERQPDVLKWLRSVEEDGPSQSGKLEALHLHDDNEASISGDGPPSSRANGQRNSNEEITNDQSIIDDEPNPTNMPSQGKEITKAPPYDISKINELKFQYCFSVPIENTPEAESALEAFVCNSLHAYNKFLGTTMKDVSDEYGSAPTPMQSADDICLLAAMALVRLDEVHHHLGKDKAFSGPYLLQAAFLLDTLLSRSPSNYQAQLLLTRIQLLLGVGSLAMKTFSRLKVKHVQTDTTLHHLVTRISTIHPHPAPYEQGFRTDAKDRDPLEALKEALAIYRASKASSLYGKNAGLENGSYINVKESITLGRDLQFSICKLMFALESRRIQRLYSSMDDDFCDVIDECASVPLADHRDFQGFLDCENPALSPFEERVRVGPKPHQRWIGAMTMTDRLFNILHSCTSSKAATPSKLEAPIPPLETVPSQSAEMTAAEISNWTMHINLTKLISFLISDEPRHSSETLKSSVTSVEEWLRSMVADFEEVTRVPRHASAYSANILVPNWSFLHWSFSLLDTLKAVTLLLNFASQSAKSTNLKSSSPFARIPEEKIADLRALTTRLFDAIRRDARRLKDALASGILEEFLELLRGGQGDERGGIGKALEMVAEKVGGESFLETHCGQMRNAWEEALDGVLLVKL